MDNSRWERFARGEGCPLDAPRPESNEVGQLSATEWNALSADLFEAQAAIMRTVDADHLNVESLGNVVPHVHWHIVPRYLSDPRWGLPIWLTSLDDMIDTRLPAEEQRALVEQLRAAFENP